MRKKDLFLQNESLFDRLTKVQAENASLKKKLIEKEKEIEDLKLKLSDIKAEEKPEKSDALIKAEEKISSKEENSDIDYGAKAIGEIVLLSAEYCGKLAKDDNKASKELINLILGKCEVSKAQILDAVSSDCEEETKKQLVDSIKREASDYFLSVLAQKI